MKTCSKCSEVKPLVEFGRHGRRKDGRHAHCLACARRMRADAHAAVPIEVRRARKAKYQATYRAKNPDTDATYMRRYRLARGFGITVEEYEARHETQGGVCALCGQAETAIGRGGVVKMLAVDHDHASGAVRGLLCQRCNLALGLLGDDPAGLQRALEYVSTRR